jgi:hypothetical protein
VTGIAHRNAGAWGTTVVDAVFGSSVASRAPSVRTVIPSASKAATTVPSRSVRSTRAPAAASRSIVARAGWPYGFPAPAEATATDGRTASTNAWVVAVRLP